MTEPIRLELPTFEALSVNSWLFQGEENVLIDCGENSSSSWNALNDQLAEHGLSISDISKVIITHAHYDHIGMANKITQHCDATIWVSEMVEGWAVNLKELLERRSIAIQSVFEKYLNREQASLFDEFDNDLILKYWEGIPAERLHVFPMDGTIDINGAAWDVIHTPGHCLNQTCFYQADSQWLLSADMLLPIIPLPIIDAYRTPPYLPTKSLLMHYESYDIIASLDIKKVFPGHMASFENTHEIIRAQTEKIQSRIAACLSLIQNGTHDFMGLIRHIYPKRINAATGLMIVGCLEMLMEEGKIKVDYESSTPKINSL